MRFWRHTIVHKLVCVARYFVLRVWYARRFSASGVSMVGGRNTFVIRPGGRVRFGDRCVLDDDVQLESAGELTVGARVTINRFSRIIAHQSVEIGDDVAIAQFVTILDHDHAFEIRAGQLVMSGYRTAPVKIGNRVWLGDKCTVLRGVTIGDNVVVGAHTLVNKDVPPNCVIAGTPFRIIRMLDS